MKPPSPGIDWRRNALPALMLAALQVLTLNHGYLSFMGELPLAQSLVKVLILVGSWWGLALGLAVSAQWVEGRWSQPAIVALALLGCALTILQAPLNRLVQTAIGMPVDRLSPSYIPFAWLAMVGGLPFFAYCLLAQRERRVGALLAIAERERARSAALLDDARADALEGRVDTAMLQRVLIALKTLYGRDRAAADALLDALVDFLRRAMPAVRNGRSTLLDELALLRRYTTLLSLLDGGPALCTVDAEALAYNPGFPPLLLIPLAEALARAQQGPQPPCLRLIHSPGEFCLEFDAEPVDDWLAAPLRQRLEQALRGISAGARLEIGGARALRLWLPLPPPPKEEFAHEAHALMPAAR